MAKDINELLNTDVEAIVAEGQKGFKRTKKKVILAIVIFIALCAIAAGAYFVFQQIHSWQSYNYAVELMEAGKYDEAIAAFQSEGLVQYKDSAELVKKAQNEKEYSKAIENLENERYTDSLSLFQGLGDFKDSKQQVEIVKSKLYELGLSLLDQEKGAEAEKIFMRLNGYKDSAYKCKEAHLKAHPFEAIQLYLTENGEALSTENCESFSESSELSQLFHNQEEVYCLSKIITDEIEKSKTTLTCYVPAHLDGSPNQFYVQWYFQSDEEKYKWQNGLWYEACFSTHNSGFSDSEGSEVKYTHNSPVLLYGETYYVTLTGNFYTDHYTKASTITPKEFAPDSPNSSKFSVDNWQASFESVTSLLTLLTVQTVESFLAEENIGITLTDLGFTDY